MTLWHKVTLQSPSPAAIGQPGPLPPAVRGLAPATLADLTVLAGSVPELDGTGWWPVTEVDEDLAEPRLVSDEGPPRVEIARPLAGRREALRQAVTAEYARRLALGCAYGGEVVPLPSEIQMQLMAKALEALIAAQEMAVWDTGFGWRTIDDDRLALATPQAMLAFALAVSSYLTAMIVRHGALHDAIEAADSHAELDAIDIEGGWPETGYPG